MTFWQILIKIQQNRRKDYFEDKGEASAWNLHVLCICDSLDLNIHLHHISGIDWMLPNLILLEGIYWYWVIIKMTVILLLLSFTRKHILFLVEKKYANNVDST